MAYLGSTEPLDRRESRQPLKTAMSSTHADDYPDQSTDSVVYDALVRQTAKTDQSRPWPRCRPRERSATPTTVLRSTLMITTEHRCIGQGHPLRGYRYWKVYNPDGRKNEMIVETGALDQPGPLRLDPIKFIAGASSVNRMWSEYVEDFVGITRGQIGSNYPEYSCPQGSGCISASQVLGEVRP